MAARTFVALLVALGLAMTSACGSVEEPDQPEPRKPDAAAAVAAVLALATGADDRVPWAPAVTYSINGVRVANLEPGPDLPGGLSACRPGSTEVEGHPCPVSPLRTLASADRSVVTEEDLPDHVGCDVYDVSAVPEALRSEHAVLRPPVRDRDCFGDFAVTLFFDDAGTIAWLDFTLSGP